ncbi:MAG: DUF4445 domain-containing protein, partial [Desulfobulbaceae bacterium]|nr:DUF4445 domain-containing protein [Desulfobulbaceae bacterium]
MMDEHMHALPVVRCVDIIAPEPSLQDNTADLDRLKKVLSPVVRNEFGSRLLNIPFRYMKDVAASFREAGFRGSAVLNVLPGLIDIVDFPPAMPEMLPGMALDLGTTHLEATLVDLLTGEKLAHAHAVNRQIEYGADILSRIHFATRLQENESGLAVLQQAVVASIDALAAELARSAGVEVDEIRALSVSGNTTMVHLLLGFSPYHICREPYIPLVNAPDPFTSGEIGLRINAAAPVWVLPSIGSYFGGDLISGILSSGLDTKKTTSMLIDVGTNAEVVLGNSDWLIACAGAAGPALEGGVAKMGMRAGPGAIEHVRLDTKQWRLDYQTIDEASA